jgi:poly-gamma-glutamate synthesis protein (capsule biosynthesis protein)
MRLLCVGDVMLGRGVDEALATMTPPQVWGDTLPLLHAADVRLCNLECVLTRHSQPWGAQPGQSWKMFHFRGDPAHVACLEAAGIQMVSLANNHVLDYQREGLREMLTVLDAHHIAHAGAGPDLDAARRSALWTGNGKRIAMLALTDNEAQWAATPENGGVWYAPLDEIEDADADLRAVLTQLGHAADLRIVSAHWGGNAGYRPPEEHRRLAHDWIEAGANLVFGHSSHVFRGVELYRGAAILYGAGDFLDDYAVDLVERNDEAMAFQLEYSEPLRLERVRMLPCLISGCRVHRARGAQAQRIAWRMMELCEEFGTASTWNEAAECLLVAA